MSLVLDQETEIRLRSVAVDRGTAPEETLRLLLNRALDAAETEDKEMQAELKASVADYAAGRSMTLDEYRVRAAVRRQQRDSRQSSG